MGVAGMIRCGVAGVMLAAMTGAGLAQASEAGKHGVAAADSAPGGSSATRYFELTVVLDSGPSEDGKVQAGVQSITTEVAVMEDRPGSCKARMTSQVPARGPGRPEMVELGTKFDGNDVRVEGEGLALRFVLESSRLSGFVTTKGADGAAMEEPLITARTVALSVKLPLNTPTLVFDSRSTPKGALQPLASLDGGSRGVNAPPARAPEAPQLRVELMAVELK